MLPPSPSEDDTKHSQLNTEDSTNDLVFPSAIVDEHSPEILPYTSSSSGKSCLTATTVDTSLSNLLAGSNTSETQANSDPVSKLLGNWSGLSFSFLGGARDSDDNVGVSMLGGTLINQEETEGSKIAPIGTPQHQPKVPKQSPVDQAAAKDDFYTVPANTNNSGSTAELQVGMDSTSSVDFLALFVDVEKEFVVCGSVVVVVGEDNVCAVVGEMGECVTENEIGLHYDWTKTAFA